MSISSQIQRAADIFRVERLKIRSSQIIIRSFGSIMLLVLFLQIWGVVTPEVKNLNNLFGFIYFIFLLIFSVLLALFTYVATGLAILISFIPLINISSNALSTELTYITRAFVEKVLFQSLNLSIIGLNTTSYLGSGADALHPLVYLLNKPQRDIYEPIIVNGMILFFLFLALITGINFVIKGNLSQAISTFLSTQIALTYALFMQRVIPLSFNSSTVFTLLGSSYFQIGFVSYLFLEFAFQTSYLASLVNPNLERQNRVAKQLEELSKFKLGVTEFDESGKIVDRKVQTSQEEQVSGDAISMSAGGSGSTSAKKFGGEALLFLLENTQSSLFSRPGGEKAKLTGRLQRYYEGLLRHDQKLNQKLGGTTAKTFNPLYILFYISLSSILRISAILLLSWLVLNPKLFYQNINFPKTITQSIEFNQPEGLLLVFVPLVFLILGVSLLLIKLLNISRKSEELIISEIEIESMIKRGKAVTSREAFEGGETPSSTSQATQRKTKPKRRKRRST